MTYVKQHIDQIKSIPDETWQKKLRHTIVGLGALVTAFFLKKWGWFADWKYEEWLLIGLLVFGGYSLAGDLVRGFFGFIPAVIRDVKKAIKGTK